MKIKSIFAVVIFVCISACATTNRDSQSPVAVQPLPYPINRLSVTVIGKSDFPSATVENWAIEVLSRKGYEIVTRAEILRKVEEEQRVRGKDKATENKSANIEGADGMFFLEVTEWKTRREQNATYIEELAIVGKVVNPVGGKYLWIRNEVMPSPNIIEAIVGIPLGLLGAQSSPLGNVLAKIFNAFPQNGIVDPLTGRIRF